MRLVRYAMARINFRRPPSGLVDVLRSHTRRAAAALIVRQPKAVRREDQMPTKHVRRISLAYAFARRFCVAADANESNRVLASAATPNPLHPASSILYPNGMSDPYFQSLFAE